MWYHITYHDAIRVRFSSIFFWVIFNTDDLSDDEESFDSDITEILTESDENDESEASSDDSVELNESEESTVSSSSDEELPDLTPRTSYKRPRQDVEGMVTRSQVKKLKRK
jgi:hypothetical protein